MAATGQVQTHQAFLPQYTNEPMSQQVTSVWSSSVLVLSVFSAFCCTVCGVPAMVIALMAYSDHKVNDVGSKESRLGTARALAITSIVLGVLSIVLVIVVQVMLVGAVVSGFN